MSHNFFRKSLCRNQYLHRFELKEQSEDGVKEVCLICGLSKFFRLIEGKFNNYGYMEYHQRQGLYPIHPYYEREYKSEDNSIISPYI